VGNVNKEVALDHNVPDPIRLTHAVLYLADQLDEFRQQLHDDIEEIKATMLHKRR
jgi:hypothetical protein